MQLFLMRHGEAAWTAPDETRKLTERGGQQTAEVLRRRAGEMIKVQTLLVSPYQRALQSAALFEELQSVAQKQVVEWLTPDTDPRQVIGRLAEVERHSGGDNASVLLVAHNPLLTRLLNLLLGESAGRYHMGTSALAALDLPVVAEGCAELHWLEPGC